MNPTEQRWKPQRALSILITIAMILVPIGAAVFSASALANILPRPESTVEIVLWWLAVLGISFFAAWLADNVMRRFAPMASLWRMSLVFPDRAPSRFGIALRSTNVSELRRRASEAEEDVDLATSAETILALATALSSHDRKTRGHSERTRAYTDLIADELGLDDTDIDKLRWAALLHDIGKLEISGEILNKSGPLTPDEFEQIKRHPILGMGIAAPLLPWLGDWARTIADHHEKWDGSGYPRGLAGEEISLGGRVVAVADSYDVMTSGRSYQTAKTPEVARREIVDMAGSQFDPRVARALMSVSIGKLIWLRPLGWFASIPFVGGIDRFLRDAGTVGSAAALTLMLMVTGLLPGLGDDGPPAITPTTEVAASEEEPPTTQAPTTSPVSVNPPPPSIIPPTTPDTTTPPTTTPPATEVTTTTTPETTPGSTFPLEQTTTTSSTSTTSTSPTITTSPPPTTLPLQPSPDTATVVAGREAVTVRPLGNDSGNDLTLSSLNGNQLGEATIDGNDTTFTYHAHNGATGVDDFEYSVCDAWERCATAGINITVTSPPEPILTPSELEVLAGEVAVADVLADDNGENLTITALRSANAAAQAAIETELGEGRILPNDTIEYRAKRSVSGVDELIYVACDDDGDCARSELTINLQAQPEPKTEPDNATVGSGKSVTVPVLANDNGDELVLSGIPTPPSHGEASITAGQRRIEYRSAAGHSGEDTFVYETCDRQGDCATGRVTILVQAPPAPRAQPDTGRVEAGKATTIQVLANDSGAGITVTEIDQGTVDLGDATISEDANAIHYSARMEPGTDEFSYRICDRFDRCATSAVTVTVTPRRVPQAQPDSATVEQGHSVNMNVLANDRGDDLILDAIVQPPSRGTAVIGDNQEIAYTSDRSAGPGADSFRYRVCDDDGDCATAPVAITVTPRRVPQLQPDIATVELGHEVEVDVLSNDEGDGLVLDAILTQPDLGSVEITADHTLRYRANPDQTGQDTLRYRACDDDGDCAAAGVTVRVRLPDVDTQPDHVVVLAGEQSTINVLSNDDGDNLELVDLDQDDQSLGLATMTGNQVAYRAHPSVKGQETLSYEVCDRHGTCAREEIHVTVDPQPIPLTQPDSGWVNQGEFVVLDVVANDNGDGLVVENTRGATLGNVTITPDGTGVRYQARDNVQGLDAFEYRVCDIDGDCVWGNITVRVYPNRPPTAQDDWIEGPPGSTTTVDVLANDADPDNDDLVIGGITMPVDPYVSAEVIGDQIRVDLPNRNPPTNRNTEIIDYQVCDPDGLCSTARLIVRLTRRWDTGSMTSPTITPGGWWGPDPRQDGRWSDTTDPIVGSGENEAVYQTEQYGPEPQDNNQRPRTYGYQFDVSPGRWRVRLHFAEIYWNADGRRVFDVFIEEEQKLDDLDIHALVGHDVAHREAFDVTVTDATLNIRFEASVDNASIVGIELIPMHETLFELAGRRGQRPR